MALQWQEGLDFLCKWEEDWNKDCVGSNNNVRCDACIERPEEEIWASGLLWSHEGRRWCGGSIVNWCFDEDQNEAMDTECQLLPPQYSEKQCQNPLQRSEQEKFIQFQIHLATWQRVGDTLLGSANREAHRSSKNYCEQDKACSWFWQQECASEKDKSWFGTRKVYPVRGQCSLFWRKQFEP